MNVSPWVSLKRWVSLNVFKHPVRQQPRNACEHHAGCYLCPRSRCVGALNDRDDPDLTKPRPSTLGHCIVIPGPHGVVRMRVSMETANSHAARRAAKEQEHIPPHLWRSPGYDEQDVPAFLRSITD